MHIKKYTMKMRISPGIKYIFSLSILFGSVPNLRAQGTVDSTDRKDTFMIWIGHRQPGGIFVADNGAVITYDSINRKPVFRMPANRNSLQPVVEQVNNTETREDDLKHEGKSNENGYKNYPIIKEALKYYEKLKEETKNAVLKDIDWGNDDRIPPSGMGPTALKNFVLNQCTKIKAKYDDIISYANSVRGQRNFNLPVPPSADYFNCWGCHKNKRDEYDTLVEHYGEDFFREENRRI